MAVLILFVVAPVLVFASLALWWRTRQRAQKQHREMIAALQAAKVAHDAELAARRFEAELGHALEQAQTEREVLDVVRAALARLDPHRPAELHLVDENEPVLRLAMSTIAARDDSPVIASPWDSVAARTGAIVTYDSTERLDACHHLRSRVTEPCSAICVPLTVMGRILGVLYATGPDGQVPSERAVRALDAIARTAATHIAIVRAFDKPADSNNGDTLTGLPDLRAAIDTLRRRLGKDRPFGVALCDIDHFRLYNSRHTATVGDAALRLLTEVLLKAVRPHDYVARIDGQQFLLVVNEGTAADAVRVVERIRETLVVTQAVRPEPAFTVSFGIADSRQSRAPEGLLQFAGDALEMAKRDGRNRVVVSEPPIRGLDFPNL